MSHHTHDDLHRMAKRAAFYWKTLRLLAVNMVIGFFSGPVLLVVWIGTISFLYDHSPGDRGFLLGESLEFLVSSGSLWLFISGLFCILLWLPVWLTQSPAFHPPEMDHRRLGRPSPRRTFISHPRQVAR